MITGFILVTLIDSFWLLAFFGTLIFDPGGINGAGDVIGFLIIQTVLTGFWIPLFRRLRGGRPGSNRSPGSNRRPPGRGVRRFVQRTIQPTPYGRHTLAGDPVRPRTGLSTRQVDYAAWLTRQDRADTGLPEDGMLARLAAAEQALGNALYELDLRRGGHSLTREQISALRLAGLDASARLTTQADFDFTVPRGVRKAKKQIQDGVRRYADLACEAENFLVGRAGVADLDRARESLIRSQR